SPKPSLLVKDMNSVAVEFELTFFVEELRAAAATQNELFDLMHRHLAAAGIALATPDGTPALPVKGNDAERLLDQVSIFASMAPEERIVLAKKLKRKRYELGETLLTPGTVLQSLFLVGAGVLSIALEGGSKRSELLRLGPGDHFGEIGMLTGEASQVSITALTRAVVYELAKADLT